MSFPIQGNHVAPCVRVFYYTVSLVPVLYQHGHIQTNTRRAFSTKEDEIGANLVKRDDTECTAARSRNTLNNVVRNRTRLGKVLVIESLIGIKGNRRVVDTDSEIVRVQIQPQVYVIVVSTTGN